MKTMNQKSCPRCNKYKPATTEHFAKNKNKPDGLQVYCKECMKQYRKKWGKDNPERERYHKQKQRVRKYDLTFEEMLKMLEEQNNSCVICGQNFGDTADHKGNEYAKIMIDHSHRTGKVRGILCRQCNGGLGQFKDDVALLQKAIQYLTEREYNDE